MRNRLIWRRSMIDHVFDVMLEGGHSCANVGCGIEKGKKWMTIYIIDTDPKHRRQGEATRLIDTLKAYCQKGDVELAAWCPMNDAAEKLFEKMKVKVYA